MVMIKCLVHWVIGVHTTWLIHEFMVMIKCLVYWVIGVHTTWLIYGPGCIPQGCGKEA